MSASIPPEILLIYLRSPNGPAQLAGLQVGSGVPHICPGTLTSAVSIPLPTDEERRYIMCDYEKLCDLENHVARLEVAIAEIAKRRWPNE